MSIKLGDRVHGKGYSREDFTPDELAASRHRSSILDDEFRSPDELLRAVPPTVVARHIGLTWIVAPSLFVRDNKTLIGVVVGAIGALNWQKVADVATLIAEVMK